jgi:DNA-3-methyladenine glycosylase
MKIKRLRRAFFQRKTINVARELLGKYLVVWNESRRQTLVGKIVETEAYCGQKDKACHASWRKRQSCEVLWGEAGHLYVYLTYGMHWLVNIVTEKRNYPAAVLIRAIEPIGGVSFMAENRGAVPNKVSIGNGPGKLTKALGISGSLNGEDLEDSRRVWVEDRGIIYSRAIISHSPRIGIDYAGAYKNKLWRFFIKQNPFVSRP